MSTDDYTSNGNRSQEYRYQLLIAREQGKLLNDLSQSNNVSRTAIQQTITQEQNKIHVYGREAYEQHMVLARLLDLDSATSLFLLENHLLTLDQLLDYTVTHSPRRETKKKTYSRIIARLAVMSLLPDAFMVSNMRRNDLTDDEWNRALEYWNGRCAICGFVDEQPIHRDHWIANTLDFCPGETVTNMVPLCWQCNESKIAWDPYLWLVKKFGKAFADQKMMEVLIYFNWWREQGRE